jgi:tRNA threonylcarbamoyl adenosine modification protein (Sua5/YciO/YrdC/YwlC family)
MLLKFYGDSINEKHITLIQETLKNDGVIVLPTDTVYAFACSIYSNKAIERISRIKNVKAEKANFSFLCHDLGNISEFTTPFSREIFRFMKSILPGPYTFILNANSNVPSIFKSNKKSIGIRVPDNKIALSIINNLGNPLMVSSVRPESDTEEYLINPDDIHEKYGTLVDLVIDGGPGGFDPSTVIDCTGETPILVREGKGIENLKISQ